MNNLEIYETGRVVPPEAKKTIGAGRLKGMTDINPMWRIKKLTEMFGPCGVGWWYDITDKHIVSDEASSQKAAFVDILLYYVDPETGSDSHGIPGTGGASFVAQERSGPYMSDECFKMALTDAISVAAKALGIGADVYFEGDRSKYSGTASKQPKKEEPVMFKCENCGKILEPYVNNGKEIGIRHHAESSKAKFGKVLCLDCIARTQGAANENAG